MPKRIATSARPKGRRNRRSAFRAALRIECLETRALLTANLADPSEFTLTHGSGVCLCPICTGEGLDQLPVYEAAATVSGSTASSAAAKSPLSAIPALSSLPSATAKLYLDFNGHTEAIWGEYRNIVTPAYDIDGDRNTFSAAELANIQQIWARVAEDYAPFNIDVTTIDPGNFANKVAVRVVIGGHYSDWFGSSAGGVAYIGGFYNSAPNVAYVFEDALSSGNPRFVAEAASHEAGHLFGLEHQSLWSGSKLVDAYHSGNASWAPIMGVGYYSTRTTWHNGPTSKGPNAYQDELAILASATNGFGYRADDWANVAASASAIVGTNVNIAGVIERVGDIDMFAFTTGGGAVNLTLNVAQFGANLDAELRIERADGTVVVASDPANGLGASISTTLAAGTYYIVARGSTSLANQYGNLGQYTITGALPAAAAAPEIDVAIRGVPVADGGSYSYGTTTVGARVGREITITNTGNGVLTLSPVTNAELPAGFEIGVPLTVFSLAPGQSTSFRVALTATVAGNYSGVFRIRSNDADEGVYDISLSGVVLPAGPAPEIEVAIRGVPVADGGTYSYGTTTVGGRVGREVMITNTGNAVLTLNPVTNADLPAGFEIGVPLTVTSLAPGQSTSFRVALTATTAGQFGGVMRIYSNDSDESPYDIAISGTVLGATAAPVVLTMDDGAAGFSTVGNWYTQTDGGREGDYRFAYKGNGSMTATWDFTGLPAGTYRVYASYTAAAANSTNAPYSIYNGGALLTTQRVNQQVLPATLIDGTRYQLLGTFTITGSQLVVRLNNSANKNVVADAIRIEQVTTAGAALAHGATYADSMAVAQTLAVDLVHRGADQTPAAANGPASPGPLADRGNAAAQQLASVASRLQNLLHSRAVDLALAHGSVLADGLTGSRSAGANSAAAADIDSLLSDEADWLALD